MCDLEEIHSTGECMDDMQYSVKDIAICAGSTNPI